LLIASTLVQASALMAATTTMASCRSMPAYDLRVHVIDEAGATPETLQVAAEEASEIWRRAGLRLTWTSSPELPGPPDGRSVIVVIRRDLKRSASASAVSAKGPLRPPLGWLVFDEQGRSGHLIEVSFAATAALVKRGSQTAMPVTMLPDFARVHLLGRGLGRVVAHEIGHWLMGRGHADTGLMRAAFSAHDIVDFHPPALPKAWMAADTDPRVSSSGCVPLALHRLIAN
jgi:hypothetical protein